MDLSATPRKTTPGPDLAPLNGTLRHCGMGHRLELLHQIYGEGGPMSSWKDPPLTLVLGPCLRPACRLVPSFLRTLVTIDARQSAAGFSFARMHVPFLQLQQAFDGLLCSWKLLAQARGHNRIYLNPPWSHMDSWLEKAGFGSSCVLPRWSHETCRCY